MDSSGVIDDGWHLVAAHPATEIREEKQIEEWERSKGHWSGVGKHPVNWCDHKTLRVLDRELGVGSYGIVERVAYRTVTMARKHVKPRRGLTVEKLREEANVMERLVHKHILKLIGTYTLKRNDLYLLLYPAAVCDLSRFLEDIDDIRLETYADREDAQKRVRMLGLRDIGTIDDTVRLRNPGQSVESPPRAATAVGFLQQILGCITEALAFVHEKEIRHRDLKPKNILLSPGRVYLADFGISRDVRESEDSVTSGRYGSPFWMAPEVHDEQDHHMSPADIWSLGCIFLNIATLLYGEPLTKYDEIMKENNWKKKYEALPKYLSQLQANATAAGLGDEEAPNLNVKHILGLIETMLKYNPDERPTAIEVNARLSELGGLDQIYHLSCCHKKNAYVSQVINKKLKSIHDNNNAYLLQISQLETENAKIRERLAYLESIHGTFEQRIENERKHAGEQYKALKEKYDREVESRKALEERLQPLDARPPHRPRSQTRGKGRSQGFLHANGSSSANANRNGNGNQPKDSTLVAKVPHFQRPSRVPLPIRPSTPIRPSYNRDPSSNSSTLTSSVHSIFSRAGTTMNDFVSPASSATIRSSSPDSPTSTTQPSLPVLDAKSPVSPAVAPAFERRCLEPETRRPVFATKQSWASMVARSTAKA